MHKIFTSLLCLYALAAGAQSPITLDVNDISGVGGEYLIANANPVIAFDGAATGPDYHWDFTTLAATTHDTTRFVDVEETDPFYFFLWLASDLAQQTGSDIVNAFVTIEDVYNFYERSAGNYAQTGFAGIISGVPLPIQYDDPETIFEFPASFNDVTTSSTGFNISIPGLATWIEQRDRTNTIDGWGTISTPTGDFDVLRMRSSTAVVDTFIYDTFTVPVGYTSVEYRWMAKTSGIPILQINATEIFGIETVTQVIYKEGDVQDAVQNTGSIQNNLQIGQNPVHDNMALTLNVDAGTDVELMISDITGKIWLRTLLSLSSGVNYLQENVQMLPAGCYTISVSGINGNFAAEQFVKQ